MNNRIHFSCSALAGTTKKGILRPDENGYYTMPIGGLNVFNSAGQFYTYDGAKELFQSSSSFMRRVKTGCLKGESGHPKRLPNQSFEDFANRIMSIDERNICVHFSEIWLDFDSVKDASGKPIIAIMSKLTPSGPNGPALQKSLDNPKEEVCFSIRAWTDDKRMGSTVQRTLKEIVTFDNVTEPGIATARKYFAPALESLTDVEFTKDQLVSAARSPALESLGMESSRSNTLSLFESLGWTFDKNDIPPAMRW